MSQTPFNCILCLHNKSDNSSRRIGESRICNSCCEEGVKPLFTKALEHEHHYPPMWGREELHLEAFCDLFDDEFVDAWRRKKEEYATPAAHRLYCEHRDRRSGIVCGEYLGEKGDGFKICSRCQCLSCRVCGMSNDNAIIAVSHVCTLAGTNPCESLDKGRLYQQCPGCQQNIFLADGCNHMTCRPPCNTHFCFACGERVAAHQSGHWQIGGCPRFGQNIYDAPGAHSEDGTDDSDVDERDLIEQDLRDIAEIQQLIGVFDHAADAERAESNRTRSIQGVASGSGEDRIRFFGFVSSNLAILLQLLRSQLDLDRVSDLLDEFTARHQRISHEYHLNQGTETPQAGTVTNLSDLSDEFDAYFVFALEAMADLTVVANAQRARPESANHEGV